MSDYPANYEAARAELRDIVAKLESGGQSLEESLALWERGEQLADVCQQWLQGASTRLEEAIAAHDAAVPKRTAPAAAPDSPDVADESAEG